MTEQSGKPIKTESSWMASWGFALGCAAFVGWILSTLLPDPVSVSSGYFSTAAAILTMLFVGMILHPRKEDGAAVTNRPRLVHYRSDDFGNLLFAPNDWLTYGSGYVIYAREENEYERIIGLGHVANVQENKFVQIEVIERAGGAEGIWTSLDNGSRDYFRSIGVKPGSPLKGML